MVENADLTTLFVLNHIINIQINIQLLLKRLFKLFSEPKLWNHSCMLSPLASDPMRVQSCVCCLSEPIEIVWW